MPALHVRVKRVRTLGCSRLCWLHGGWRWLRWGGGGALARACPGCSVGSPLLAFFVGLRVGHVLKLLRAAGENFGGEDAIPLVDRDSYQPLELPRKQAVSPEGDQQLPCFVKDLHAILHSVGNPDMTIAVDGHAFGSREVSRAVPI